METKTTNTPGPWISQQTAGHDKHGQSVVYSEKTGKDVALVYDGDADAQLIEAAPDLLAAVKQVLNASEDNGDMNDIDWYMLRTAVTKAEG